MTRAGILEPLVGWMVTLLLVGGSAAAQAQSDADAYFHEAAQQYVADEVQAARRTVERGLKVAPSDARLRALQKKLREGKRPNDQDGKQDSSATGSNEESQQGDNSSTDESSEGGQEPSEEEEGGATQPGRPESPSSEQAGPRSDASPPSDGSARAGRRRSGQNGGRPVDSLSRAQAERLLRALEGQERQLLRQLRPESAERRTAEKDW